MTIRLRDELIPLNILAILLILIITFFPSNPLRVIVALPFILFFPGYALIAALFLRKTDLGSIERVALSLGGSIAVVPLIGLILNYTPWGISLYPILTSVTTFILATSAVAWYRRHKLAEGERFAISINLSLSPWRGQNTLDKVLSIILIATILGAIGTLGYVIAAPKVGEDFTEFYIQGLGGKPVEYSKELRVGREGKVIVGIVNWEHDTVDYRVEVLIDGVRNNEIGGIILEHGGKWEQEVSFVPEKVGENQKLEFVLYKHDETKPNLKPLYLRIDVIH
jgi:uncharacterized membrane protein